MLRYLEQFPVFMYRAAVKKLDQKIEHRLGGHLLLKGLWELYRRNRPDTTRKDASANA